MQDQGSHLSSGPSHTARVERPGIKREYHTWHGETRQLSHFEDFMLEIGADPKVFHLCCVPHQGFTPSHHHHKRAKTGPSTGKQPARDENSLLSHQNAKHNQSKSPVKVLGARGIHGLDARSNEPHNLVSARHAKRHSLSSPVAFIGAPSKQLKARPISAVHPDIYSASFAGPSSLDGARDSLLTIGSNYSITQISCPEPIATSQEAEIAWTSGLAMRISPSEPIPTTSSSAASTRTVRSRTSSTASLSTASSSEGPETPRAHSPLMTPPQELHRSLSDLEDTSKFRIPARCATCKRPGSNFPCCPKCGDMWCSRHCRMVGGQGGKHSCQCREIEPTIVFT
ncbi:hypothetical protein BXZ70DRAFT_598566 [Cristinia sonorae]|uniref:Uncharacterized protein n=1 Tax=Cristinia sonorae TaxID=1940300 RepID=A0A8K0XT29_9AGAR|nr:hypothetical protein BXZ70DRAFT_598566 [Cristinia sonorae]